MYKPIILLTISNIFMTFAWYGHLRFKDKATWIIVFAVFSITYLKEDLRWNHYAGFALIICAAFLIFKK